MKAVKATRCSDWLSEMRGTFEFVISVNGDNSVVSGESEARSDKLVGRD